MILPVFRFQAGLITKEGKGLLDTNIRACTDHEQTKRVAGSDDVIRTENQDQERRAYAVKRLDIICYSVSLNTPSIHSRNDHVRLYESAVRLWKTSSLHEVFVRLMLYLEDVVIEKF